MFTCCNVVLVVKPLLYFLEKIKLIQTQRIFAIFPLSSNVYFKLLIIYCIAIMFVFDNKVIL